MRDCRTARVRQHAQNQPATPSAVTTPRLPSRPRPRRGHVRRQWNGDTTPVGVTDAARPLGSCSDVEFGIVRATDGARRPSCSLQRAPEFGSAAKARHGVERRAPLEDHRHRGARRGTSCRFTFTEATRQLRPETDWSRSLSRDRLRCAGQRIRNGAPPIGTRRATAPAHDRCQTSPAIRS